jgi:hypothetical protein
MPRNSKSEGIVALAIKLDSMDDKDWPPEPCSREL